MILPRDYNPIIYMCSEFAIDSELPTYAGGLGILAGDYMNECALNHFPIIGIGLLYKGKHFLQHITAQGHEEKRDSEFDHDTSFLRPTTIKGKAILLEIPTPDGKIVHAKSYHIRLSDEAIQFFLSTDVDTNPPKWRADMSTLYSGDPDSQMRQMTLLGIGGIMLVEALSIKPKLYHFNEGRPIFAIWEITKNKMQAGLDFEKAWDEAKNEVVYTNHTLVAAGNPKYNVDTLRWWAKPFAEGLGVEVDKIIQDGFVDGQFSITGFALNNSKVQSAVSKVHGKYSRKQYPDYNWVAITNGVHMYRWQDSEFRNSSLTDQELWQQHMRKKKELADTVAARTGFGYDHNRLVISWARRLAAYKQPTAIFEDVERLNQIVSQSKREVQFLYAGNSHAADPGSKNLIDEVIRIFAEKLNGHAIFIPNYNITLANHLVSGSDVWLNTPKGNLEACGTSGMKAISNGVLNCTVLDGWTYEVDWTDMGWTIDPDNVCNDFYELLEQDIIPCYYGRNEMGVPEKWIIRMRNSIKTADKYSAKRMLEEYEKKLYSS